MFMAQVSIYIYLSPENERKKNKWNAFRKKVWNAVERIKKEMLLKKEPQKPSRKKNQSNVLEKEPATNEMHFKNQTNEML